jgi:hypothetical protein
MQAEAEVAIAGQAAVSESRLRAERISGSL